MNSKEKLVILLASLAFLGCGAFEQWFKVSDLHGSQNFAKVKENAMEFYKNSFGGLDAPTVGKVLSAEHTPARHNYNQQVTVTDFKVDLIIKSSDANIKKLQRCQTTITQFNYDRSGVKSHEVKSFSCQKIFSASSAVIGALDTDIPVVPTTTTTQFPKGLVGAGPTFAEPQFPQPEGKIRSASEQASHQAAKQGLNLHLNKTLSMAFGGGNSYHFLLDFEAEYQTYPKMPHRVTCFYSVEEGRVKECDCDEVANVPCK